MTIDRATRADRSMVQVASYAQWRYAEEASQEGGGARVETRVVGVSSAVVTDGVLRSSVPDLAFMERHDSAKRSIDD